MAIADGRVPAVYWEPLTADSAPLDAVMAKTETVPEEFAT